MLDELKYKCKLVLFKNYYNIVISALSNLPSDVSILEYTKPFEGELFLEIENNTAWVDFEKFNAKGQGIY